MSKSEMLDVVRRARELLARTWVPGIRHTDYIYGVVPTEHGGHCHLGCLEVVRRIDSGNLDPFEDPISRLLDEVAVRLRPESAIGSRFGLPAVYVNNVLGRDAIVAVYDAAIEDLELAVLCEEEEAKKEEVLA